MKWKGRRQSTNVEDRELEPLPDIPEGTRMFTGEIYHKTPEMEQNSKDINAAKEVGRKGNNVPTPTPRPKGYTSHDNLVTPGKWHTKG